MLSYWLKCSKNTESKNPNVVSIQKGRTMLLSNFAVCIGKKSKFFREQDAKELLSIIS